VTVRAQIVRGDAFSGAGLQRALEGIEVAYYLIHSMERAAQSVGSFEERDRVAAENFARAAHDAGVRRIVYLGGLLPREVREHAAQGGVGGERSQPRGGEVSRHLESRAEVERTLLAAVPDSVALRASIVIGARSRSFRLLVHLIERMRTLPLPAWRRFRTAPIDARDVTEMLFSAATADVGGRSLDIGGPDVLSYGAIVRRIAEAMIVRRHALGLGANLTPITARVAAAIVGEDPQLVLRLMESLNIDLLPADDHAEELLGVSLHSFDSAVERSLREWEENERLAAR
jgi:nucleoside-diphosphate-sugar epimerase